MNPEDSEPLFPFIFNHKCTQFGENGRKESFKSRAQETWDGWRSVQACVFMWSCSNPVLLGTTYQSHSVKRGDGFRDQTQICMPGMYSSYLRHCSCSKNKFFLLFRLYVPSHLPTLPHIFLFPTVQLGGTSLNIKSCRTFSLIRKLRNKLEKDISWVIFTHFKTYFISSNYIINQINICDLIYHKYNFIEKYKQENILNET